MESSGAGIRYRWMRRIVQGIALAAGSAALLGSFSAGAASAATQSTSNHVKSAAVSPMAPPSPGSCNPAHNTWTWTDEDTGRVWECIQNILGEWVWVEITTVPPGVCYLIAIRPDQATVRSAAGHICSP